MRAPHRRADGTLDVVSSHGFYRGNPNFVSGANGMFLNYTDIEMSNDHLPRSQWPGMVEMTAMARMYFGAFLDFDADGWLVRASARARGLPRSQRLMRAPRPCCAFPTSCVPSCSAILRRGRTSCLSSAAR